MHYARPAGGGKGPQRSPHWRDDLAQGPEHRKLPEHGGKTAKNIRLPQDARFYMERLSELMGQPQNDVVAEALRDLWLKRWAAFRDLGFDMSPTSLEATRYRPYQNAQGQYVSEKAYRRQQEAYRQQQEACRQQQQG